ncbi:oxidoreductase molybdopterin binding [Gluconacetobacter diazotrophicus PA1 5]|uniref:Molybdopterin-dependent oxidoreductase n=5 Tax=Acetobacteraceae TaxID=433 RepID=A0A850PHR8_9PROT|nr:MULTISPECIES: molybdopterin-dependent oxidoreductase [Acetobacteraceae]ACI51467.1 oxidoreductase molybdopterin binding [Gluconacetobacter diazotrophicus PA1 5]MBB2157965.1 molybdopterin-dependent oxidoreductase [Gluconacetobacter diazotrophicus]MBB2199080.1 molybdopterin-dependent oxidoreductase [Gluconacetobacter dulcium]MBO1361067.1 molybdopterin-dependent oxidoreductase [Acetobacter sacchari]MBS4076483.1 molybdopterin-dependent oxidoreductase [Ameyamaea chiangmaiensis]
MSHNRLDRSAIAPELRRIERRLMLKGALSLGGLSMLSGCALDDEPSVERALSAMSRFTDRMQALLFSRQRLAREFDASRITHPFPFNAYYDESEVRTVDPAGWRLDVGGLVSDRRPWSLAQFRALPQKRQITRHICVEGWSAIGDWSGVPLSMFLQKVGADLRAKYVNFRCFDDYSTSIDMATALHPQTILALDYGDRALPPAYGAPMKVRIPTKLGYKNPKYLASIEVTNRFPGGYWEDQGYDWFGGS